MKIKSLLIAAVALILGLSACNKEEDLTQQNGLPVNAVRITASVGNPFAATRSNPVGTVEEQGMFNVGDKIYVEKFSIIRNAPAPAGVVYELGSANWAPTANKYLLWENDVESFRAGYPVDEAGDPVFDVKQDQSTLALLAMSDLMYGEINGAAKGKALNFEMKRQTSRIIVNIAGFNPEFPEGSVVSDVKIIDESQLDYSAYSPYSPEAVNGSVGSTYTLLADDNMQGPYVSLKVGEKEMKSPLLPSMELGKSYTFNLNVGKEKLEIGSVTVEDWSNTDTITGGQADEFE